MKNVIEIFTKHPEEAGMGYYEHFKFALKLSFRFLRIAAGSGIHAFFPFLFTTYASSSVRELHTLLNSRNHSPQPGGKSLSPVERPGKPVRAALIRRRKVQSGNFS